MKQLETKVELCVNSSDDFLNFLRDSFSVGKVNHKKFLSLNTFIIKNGEFTHNVWVYTEKEINY